VSEESLFIDPVFGVEPVIGAPVLLLGAAETNEVGKGGAALVEQGGEHVTVETLGTCA
jgi:hypothetical protein